MKIFFLATCLFTLSANAAIKINDSKGCELKAVRINQFVVSADNKKLSYRANGQVYQLAQSSDGLLVGRFRALMIGDNLSVFDGKWLDFAEISADQIEARKPNLIDQKYYYVPLKRTITPTDLELDGNWKINSFVFDFSPPRNGATSKKNWQFIAINLQTGAHIQVMAEVVERHLLKECRLAR